MYPSSGLTGLARVSFPRTRGDVPHVALVDHGRAGLPPHARGCTLAALHADGIRVASPARAGMYLAPGARRTGHLRFPRTRGDVPDPRTRRETAARLPPHARGCTQGRQNRRHTGWASPARAGMYRFSSSPPTTEKSFPRTRGDVPVARGNRVLAAKLPPHARGCTRPRDVQRRVRRAPPPPPPPARGDVLGIIRLFRFRLASMAVLSPCVGICRIHPQSRLCEGCGRSLVEIAEWPAWSDERRRAVLARLARRNSSAQPTSPTPRR